MVTISNIGRRIHHRRIHQLNDGNVLKKYESADYWMVKLDENGNIVWQKTLEGSSMADMLSPGTLGQTMEMCQENTVVKLNKNRNIIWQKDR